MKLSLLILLGCLHLISASGPTPNLLKTAYCACICCEDNENNCYRHPVIEPDFQCISDMCSPEFCVTWQQSKCKTSCYCHKCKKTLPKDSYKCSLFDGDILPNCECPDMDSIVCETEDAGEDVQASPEIEAAMKKLQDMKDNKHCILPCFCRQCKEGLPDHLRKDCEKTGEPDSSCVCEKVECPNEESLEKLEKIMEQSSEDNVRANKAILKAKQKIIQEELDEINEKLKPAIKEGKAKPMTKYEYVNAKCTAQCLCDKCRGESTALEASCNQMIKSRLEDCPPCDKDLKCPGDSSVDDCKLTCFCKKCENDTRLTSKMKATCDKTKKTDCACLEPVDCNILDKIAEINKQEPPQQQEQPVKKSGKGKIKEKKKLWDEL